MGKNLEARRGVVPPLVSRSTLNCCNYALGRQFNTSPKQSEDKYNGSKLSCGCEVTRPPKRGCRLRCPKPQALFLRLALWRFKSVKFRRAADAGSWSVLPTKTPYANFLLTRAAYAAIPLTPEIPHPPNGPPNGYSPICEPRVTPSALR